MKREPILLLIGGGTALVQAVLHVLVAFHVALTTDQQAALTVLAGVLLAAYARTHVTPMATLPPGVAAEIAEQKYRSNQ